MLAAREKRMVQDILAWYRRHGRSLPWRKTRNPYRIFISEGMLQQTQVDRRIPKYREFLRTFPTLSALGRATPAAVITAWKGLGYNRRALFVRRTAQEIIETHGGRFPRDLDALIALPGVGDYTARAILSFAFDRPVAVLDTNHRKFYQRTFFGRRVSDRILLKKEEEVVAFLARRQASRRGPRQSVVYEWNQALMDFMTGVSSQLCQDTLIVRYRQMYPPLPPAARTRKHTPVPFLKTDRYIRGQVIDLLRKKRQVPMQEIQEHLHGFIPSRLEQVLRGLVRDGLAECSRVTFSLPKR